jgi:nitrate/nitrite transporter NarK
MLGVTDERLLEIEEPKYRVYASRWWVAFVLGLLSGQQSAVWLTFSPISETAEPFYNISAATIALLAAYGPIMFVVTVPFVSWALDSYGLRKMVVLGALVEVVAAGIRCLATGPNTVWALHIGQILNGCVGSIALAAPAKVSQAWFAPDERATATAATTLANGLGTAIGCTLLLCTIIFCRGCDNLKCAHFLNSNASPLVCSSCDTLGSSNVWDCCAIEALACCVCVHSSCSSCIFSRQTTNTTVQERC